MGVQVTSIRQAGIDVAFIGPNGNYAGPFHAKILWSFAPHAVSAVPQDRVASEFYWRLRFYIKKATGGVPDLSWAEVVKGTWPGRQLKGTWPGSGFITGKVITEAAA